MIDKNRHASWVSERTRGAARSVLRGEVQPRLMEGAMVFDAVEGDGVEI